MNIPASSAQTGADVYHGFVKDGKYAFSVTMLFTKSPQQKQSLYDTFKKDQQALGWTRSDESSTTWTGYKQDPTNNTNSQFVAYLIQDTTNNNVISIFQYV